MSTVNVDAQSNLVGSRVRSLDTTGGASEKEVEHLDELDDQITSRSEAVF